jgi:hypothetical protein
VKDKEIFADCKRCTVSKFCISDKWDLCHWRPSDIINFNDDYVQSILIPGHPMKKHEGGDDA